MVLDPTEPPESVRATRLRNALKDSSSSTRLQAALAAGTRPDDAYPSILVARCAIEPDFFVRDMLTWAVMRHSAEATIPLLLHELREGSPQARSQALHTLSKIGDPRGWRAITRELLQDPDDEIARSAWRAAVVLVPAGSEAELAEILVTQLGRGNRVVQRSLTRALAGLGGASDAALNEAAHHGSGEVRTHALATQRAVLDPEEGFDTSIFEAKRTFALKDAPVPPPSDVVPPDPADT